MHTLEGGLVVQTFALAKSNESEGRKSRIRRSKEERKAMVESFIKKHQSSNNGNFPSLNLTHKEVGGSFYTVREIVREIIQENRVLGPAKFLPEELSYQQNEQDPLGSIAIETSTPLHITSNESHFVPNHHQATSEESISISDGLCSESENQKSDDKHVVNGYQVDVTIEESGKQTSGDSQTSEQLETEKNSAVFTDNVTSIMADIVVETFPLRPVSNIVDGLDMFGARNLTETFEESETEKVNVEQGNGSVSSGQINSSSNCILEDQKKTKSPTAVVLDRNSELVDSEVVENFADSQLKSSNNFTIEEGRVIDPHFNADVEIEVSNNGVLTSDEINEQSQKADGSKAINASNGNSLNGTYASSSQGQVRTPERIVTENEANVQDDENSHEESNPTLDRINLESWGGASRKSAEVETNPILAIFKSFVTAFIKFWSE